MKAYSLSSNGADALDKVSYDDIDMLKAIPAKTSSGYAIIGGSGFVGG